MYVDFSCVKYGGKLPLKDICNRHRRMSLLQTHTSDEAKDFI